MQKSKSKPGPSSAAASEAFFARRPVFSLEQATAALGDGGAGARATVANRLKHHLKSGRLLRVAREVYAVVPPGADFGSYRADVFLVAAAARPDAIFSHHSALELLGAAHSVWNVCTVLTAARRAPLRVTGATIRFLPHPPALVKQGLGELGLGEVMRHGIALRTTGAERTLVEGFRQPHLVGGAVELVESAGGIAVLDFALLLRLLEAYDLRRVWAAVGWFLERYRQQLFVADELLQRIARHRPRAAVYLEPGTRGGTLAPRWNLILPAALLQGQGPDER